MTAAGPRVPARDASRMVTLSLCVLFAVFVNVSATIYVSKDGADVQGCGTDSADGACLTLQFLFNNQSFSDDVVSVLPGIYDISNVRITQQNISIIAASGTFSLHEETTRKRR